MERRYLLLALLLLVVVASPLVVAAQPTGSTTQPIDVVIVLDDSESMAISNQCGLQSKPPASDPNDLRYSAARLLVQLAESDDRIAVVRFDAKADDVGDLGSLQTIEGPGNRQRLIDEIDAPTDYTGRCYTRMDLGLQRASEILAASATQGRNQYILFLTDGKPTSPSGVASQDQTVPPIIADLKARRVDVIPVLLCSPGTTGCNPDAESFINRVMERAPVRARSAGDLLQVFSNIFAQMKPNLHVVDEKNRDGDIELYTRPAHAARQINVVSSEGGLTALRRDNSNVTTQSVMQDGNIEVNVVESSALPTGKWTVDSAAGSFVVARTDTYPDVVHPPAISGNAPRYVPQGKAPLVVGTIVGPGGEEDLRKDGTPLTELTTDRRLRFMELPATTNAFSLQVGNDTAPLQIKRDFEIATRANLPLAQAAKPECAPQTACRLEVALAPGPEVDSLAAQVYVLDESDKARPVYSNEMVCTERQCADSGFVPVDGHSYRVLYTVQGVAQNTLYGDWDETSVIMEPAVAVRGLPDPLNPINQPNDGWPVKVIAGTTEDLGRLRARASVTRLADGAPLEGVDVQFSADIRGAGEQQTTLAITLPEDMRPGRYEGELTFYTDRESGDVRLPPVHKIAFNLGTPRVEVLETSLDFGKQTFDPSPNFRVDLSQSLRLRFGDRSFPLTAELLPGATCENLAVDVANIDTSGSETIATLRVWSQEPLKPGVCSGQLRLTGPGEDFKVENGDRINWRFEIPALEWKLIGVENADGSIAPDLSFADMGRATERQMLMLLVEYTGAPNFQMQAEQVGATGRDRILGSEALEVLVGRPESHSSLASTYRVPVELVAKTDIANSGLRGTVYNGLIRFYVLGLPEESAQETSFRFLSPSWLQRHVFPYYRLPWPGIRSWCSTWLAVLLLLFVMLRWRASRIEKRLPPPPPPVPPPPPSDPNDPIGNDDWVPFSEGVSLFGSSSGSGTSGSSWGADSGIFGPAFTYAATVSSAPSASLAGPFGATNASSDNWVFPATSGEPSTYSASGFTGQDPTTSDDSWSPAQSSALPWL